MNSAICTLFEGNYHYGVAALINSLCKQGYKGTIYVGYRGKLPDWSANAVQNPTLYWNDSSILQVSHEVQVHFLPLDTHYHFTNYKPDFILKLWENLASEATAIFYFDPDIVVTAPWIVFENWTAYGVCLCEDIHSPKAQHHPVREEWRLFFGARGFKLNFKESIYANGGFIGLRKKNIGFLITWRAIQEAMASVIGGLDNSFLSILPDSLPFDPFSIPDQDAMNAAVEAWDGIVSFVDKAGMSFSASSSLMSHAIGTGKPWVRKPLVSMLTGTPPRRADRDYWNSANGPILSQPTGLVRRRQIAIRIAALLGRFYSRN
ncbi:hypothetical protein HHL22_00355 [Hymenobacter sp. RP-2-7]|uniref:Uncharacterized protein n=1 Tax=Hymenobacter polaris TaxID=2682546 RepID=A0A7Y0AA89_9BACT|nr:hypothetical protein [Hymenobacter polaris]NML63651.1 hypothetical protein [Hymenobacter polaris]